ncbi:Uncharacterised protein [uncultured archaeon]|nr:Uncharacterised protein [uncultured archaeon]
MPIYVYQCRKNLAHKFERVVQVSKDEPQATVPCEIGKCRSQFIIADLIPSRTGTPIFKKGVGGFYRPNA